MSQFGLQSLNTLNAPGSWGSLPAMRIWLCLQRTDMRCGFDRLAALAGEVTGQDPLSGHLFVFRGRSGDRLKILYWDRDGYVLFYKRLEEGQFKLPRPRKSPDDGADAEPRAITLRPSELAMLLDGIDLSSVRRSKRYRRPNRKRAAIQSHLNRLIFPPSQGETGPSRRLTGITPCSEVNSIGVSI